VRIKLPLEVVASQIFIEKKNGKQIDAIKTSKTKSLLINMKKLKTKTNSASVDKLHSLTYWRDGDSVTLSGISKMAKTHPARLFR
jgi:hypothetical protein